jgi:hypothetical protein
MKMPDKTFEELQAERDQLEAQLQASKNANDAAATKIRSMESRSLEQERSRTDEVLAQRVAQILREGYSGPRIYGRSIGEPARVVGHQAMKCRVCGATFAADHSNPHDGGCGGVRHLSHDLYGVKTVVTDVDKLEPHHAIYIA